MTRNMTVDSLMQFLGCDVTFTDEAGFQYTLDKKERRMLIDIVDKQMPKKPIKDYQKAPVCANCKDTKEGCVYYSRVLFRTYDYCPTCGQKIDWSDFE